MRDTIRLWDYHIHTKLCGHAVGEMEEYVIHAIKIGLVEMGFSDHIPYEYLPDTPLVPRKEYGMSKSKLEWYFSEINRLSKKYSKEIAIKAGMEIDYIKTTQSEIEGFIKENKYRLDYILGSIHMIELPDIGIWPVDDERHKKIYEEISVDLIYEIYLDNLELMIKSGLYNIVSHLDLVKKFGYRPNDKVKYYDRILSILDLIHDKGMAIEVSTAGLLKPVKELYPEQRIIKEIINRDIPIVIDSDSHKPELVGFDFSNTFNFLKKLDMRLMCKYIKGEQQIIKIE
ncbi:MAG: histidinol-phosphatase HisJ [Promethearchaeota archaeon]